MKIQKTPIEGLVVIEPKIWSDDRGYFFESYSEKVFRESGLRTDFVQDNFSWSKKGVLRGLHFQRAPFAQAKLVRVTRGSIYDVAVDLRKDSPTFGKFFGLELNDQNHKSLLIPDGFAHGFCVLSEVAGFSYKCSNFYSAAHDGGIQWNDPDIGIRWPIENPILSGKDAALPKLKDLP